MAKKRIPSSFTTARYDTPEEAAVAATSIFNPESIRSDREVGGGIIEDDGKFYFTYNFGPEDHGNIEMKIRFPKGGKMVGLWHTHGGRGDLRDVFSATDLRAVKDHKVPFYMSDAGGNVRRLDPGTKSQKKRMFVDGRFQSVKGIADGEQLMNQNGQPMSIRTTNEQELGSLLTLDDGARALGDDDD